MKTGQFVKKLTSLLLMLTMLFSMPLYLCAPFLLWLISNHEGGKSHEPEV